MKKICVIMLTILMAFTHSMAFAAHEEVPGLDPDTGAVDIVLDVIVTRPLGLIGLVGGSAVFVLTLPVAIISKSVDRSSEVLVKEPFKYTFVRPIGDIRGERHY